MPTFETLNLMPAPGTPARLLLGGAKTIFYRKPAQELRRLRAWGPYAYFRCHAWADQMEKAARKLKPLAISDRTHHIYFLTGTRFWYQTVFCAWSYAKQSQVNVSMHLIDDGTLADWQLAQCERIFGNVQVTSGAQAEQNMRYRLSESKYPTLTKLWKAYIHIRKLIDVHLGSKGPKLVMDSDMLFFGRPTLLESWLEDQERPSLLHMVDSGETYGYNRTILADMAGAPLPCKLNVGICGIWSEWLDWEEIESWCRKLIQSHGMSYYLEQALVAMLSTRHRCTVAPAIDYITWPSPALIKKGAGILQHYVADSKPDYFGTAWKTALQKGCNCDL